MGTRPLDLAAPTFDRAASAVQSIVDITLRVVTPMIGGGVEAATIDDEMPVNGKSVRGHLRFWWRACNAHRYRNAADLFKAEAAIWGQAATGANAGRDASELSVHIDHDPKTIQRQSVIGVARGTGGNDEIKYIGELGYALFPFGVEPNKSRAMEESFAIKQLDFRLRLSESPHGQLTTDQHEEVRKAVWAWIHFGGLGMRSRRGCGSLRLTTQESDYTLLVPDEESDVQRLRYALDSNTRANLADPYTPMLKGGHLLIRQQSQSVFGAWSSVVEALKFARNPGGDIHNPTYTPDVRADLGMPIKSHGRDIAGTNSIKRLMSPFIIKALPSSSGQAQAMVLLLNSRHAFDHPPLYHTVPPSGGPPAPIRELVLNDIKMFLETEEQKRWSVRGIAL